MVYITFSVYIYFYIYKLIFNILTFHIYTEQNYKRNTCFCPYFSSWNEGKNKSVAFIIFKS